MARDQRRAMTTGRTNASRTQGTEIECGRQVIDGNRRDKYKQVEHKNKTRVAVRRLRLKKSCRNHWAVPFALRSSDDSSADAPKTFCHLQGHKTSYQLRSLQGASNHTLDCRGRKRWVEVQRDVGRMLECQPPDDNYSC